MPPSLLALVAAALLTASAASETKSAEEHFAEGVRLLNEGNLSGAIDALRNVTAADPGNARAWNALGASLNRAERYPEALEAAERAVALAPDEARYQLNLGLVYWEVGRFEDALASLDFATAALPDLALGWAEHGSVLASLGRSVEARASWDRAQQADAAYPWTEYYRGVLAIAEGDFEEGARRIELLLSMTDFGPAHLWRWVAAARLGHPTQALPLALDGWPGAVAEYLSDRIDEEELERRSHTFRLYDDRRLVSALFFIGQKQLAEGEIDAGLAAFRRALKLASPRHIERIAMETAVAAAP